MTILSMRDNDFFIDRVNPETKMAIDSAMHSQHDCMDSFWPYNVVKDFQNHLLIFNSFE